MAISRSSGRRIDLDIIRVDTLAELKDVIPSRTQVVILNGRNFYWSTGDKTAYVDADTLHAMFVESDVSGYGKTIGCWELGGWRMRGFEALDFGIVINDTTAAAANASRIQAILDLMDVCFDAGRCYLPHGIVYYTPSPSIVRRQPHVFVGAGEGTLPNVELYEFIDANPGISSIGSALVLYGDGTPHKRIRTRRLYRASSADPQDAAISAGFDNQAMGRPFRNVRLEVYCDYTDTSQGNLGANWDCFMISNRMGVTLDGCFTRGYPRYCHLLLDGTRGIGLPDFVAGTQQDTHAKGMDGCEITNFRSSGSTAIRLLGPKPAPGLLHPGYQYLRGCKIAAGGQPSDGDTVTIGSETFTFRTTKAYRYEVQIGATAADTIANLRIEWLYNKEAPYETLTLVANNTLLLIYSRSSSPTAVSETSANLSVQLLGSSSAATQTETISDPAQYYDETLGMLVDDGRNSLGDSDFLLDKFVISVAHHSGNRMTDKGADRHTEPDTVHACLHIDGFGGSIFIHKWHIGTGRMESVEPYTVRLGLCGRGSIGPGTTFDSNMTAWLTTTGGAIGANDSWGKVSAEDYNTCRVTMYTHDDPSSGFAYFPHRRNGNRLDTNFIKTVNSLISETTAIVGTTFVVGGNNHGSAIGYTEIIGGEVGQADLRFSGQGNGSFARIRGNPANGSLVISTKPTGGSLAARAEITDNSFRFYAPVRHASYTVSTVPSASLSGAGAEIYLSNESGGTVLAFSDATNWRRVTDRAVIS